MLLVSHWHCRSRLHPPNAQSYPTKPIRVITANSAGGTSDIFVRALGEELQKRLGQPIVVENRSGGGMNIAGRACAEAPNDGYNICILPNEVLTLNEFTFKSIPYNPEKDFEPITNASSTPRCWWCRARSASIRWTSSPRCRRPSPAR